MTRNRSIRLFSRITVRGLLAILLSALILMPFQTATAYSEAVWNDAREGVYGGTIGGLTIPISVNSSETIVMEYVSDLPTVVEVYTATWCVNCITTEHALDEAIGSTEVSRIHYHRHKFEVEDPFGSNSTEERWEANYGTASTLIGGITRLAPTTVFDGERLHLGTASKSGNLQEDFSTSLAEGSTHPFSGNSRLSLFLSNSHDVINLSYEFSGPGESTPPKMCVEDVDCAPRSDIDVYAMEAALTPWLLFVEESANFSEGSNGAGDYMHVLHKAVQLPVNSFAGSIEIERPSPWDGDDMSAVLIYDWSLLTQETNPTDDSVIPAPGLATLLCFLAALVPRRNSK